MRKRQLLLFVLLSMLLIVLPFWSGCGGGETAGEEGGTESNLSQPRGSEDYPPGFAFTVVPDPLSGDNPHCPEPDLPVTEVGVTFADPCYSTHLTRVTDSDGIDGRHQYSRFDPFNADGSMILLVTDEGEYAVYATATTPYNQQENLVRYTSDMQEPRWDREDPELLWGLEGFRIVRDNVIDGEREVIKDFSSDPAIVPILDYEPDIYRITMREEGEASYDRRYWAFILQGEEDDYRPRYIFCWDREADEMLGLYEVEPGESDIDWVGMSPLGNWVLIGGMDGNSGNIVGLTLADRKLERFQRIDYTTSHADVGTDTEGREVVVMQNSQTDYIDLLPLSWDTRPILEAGDGYEGTGHVPLLRLYYDSESPVGFSSGVHISCNADGYCLVSTHIEPGVPERNWLDRTNVLIRLDPEEPGVFYLSKIYNTTEAYWEETHGAMSNDGSRIVWACNWNLDPGSEDVFLLQLDMPANWRELTQ
ncbi:MAG: hypothetical protein JW854_14805 [Actinobacteria bacterium]|nr:hypothetical protein [Actinomycetota bacterium]